MSNLGLQFLDGSEVPKARRARRGDHCLTHVQQKRHERGLAYSGTVWSSEVTYRFSWSRRAFQRYNVRMINGFLDEAMYGQ